MTKQAAHAIQRTHHISQLACLTSGMRPASLDYVREHYDALPKPVAAVYPDGVVALEDGRHRVAVARERGKLWLDVDFVVYTRTLREDFRFERRLEVR